MKRTSGRAVILQHFVDRPGEWVHNQTLRSISGTDDVPRTVRSLRQEGWALEKDGHGQYRLTTLEKEAPRGTRTAITSRVRYQVLQACNFRCRACGRGIDDGVRLEVDHIRPVDWGGTNDVSNLWALCQDCNHGKQAWVSDESAEIMRAIYQQKTVVARIEALFDARPNEEIPSVLVQLVSGNAMDWQRAIRRIRERTGKRIEPVAKKTAYRYYPAD